MELLDLFVKISVDDQASGQMEGVSSGMIAKGQLIATTIQSAVSAAYNAIKGLIGGALEAYGQYEQLAGGMETFFGDAADTVIANSKRAYDSAGMSANQYMSTVSSFATSLVQSVAKGNQQVVQDNSAAVSKMLDDAYNAQSRAFQHEMTDAQRQFEDEYNALSKSLSKQVEAMTKAASKAITERQKQFEKDNENLAKSLSKELESVQAQAQAVVDARQKQFDAEYSNLSKSLDSQLKSFERATEERLKLMDKEYRQRVKQLDAEKAAAIAAVDGQIDAINKQADAEELARKQAVQSEKLAELQKQLNSAKTRKGRERAQKELNDYLAEIEADRLARERREQIEGLKDQRDDIREHYDELKDKAREQYDEEKDAYRQQRSEQLSALKESNAQQLALMRENQKKVLQQVRDEENEKIEAKREANQKVLKDARECQQAELEQMRENSNEKIAAQREANEEILKQEKRNQQDQLTALRESQQDQLAAMKDSIDKQKAALQDAAKANSGYVTATAEDQKRAAELADMAVRDMADNANKTGTAIEMIQNAYQGFAKQNYTMLDNLKLGYAGTKEGMQNLLDDAERVSAGYGEMRDFSIDSLSDIIEAIHIMQVEMGISGVSVDELKEKMANNDFTVQELTKLSEAWYGNRDSIDAVRESIESGSHTINDFSVLLGTTAMEGSNTYEGSINRVKAAWENWLISLTDPDWDVAESTQVLMENVGDAAEIIIPRVATILETLFKYVAEHGPEIMQQLRDAFMNALPDEWREKVEEFERKIAGLFDTIQSVSEFAEILVNVFTGVYDFLTQVGELVEPALLALDDALAPILETANTLIGMFMEYIMPIITDMIETATQWIEILGQLMEPIMMILEPIGMLIVLFTQIKELIISLASKLFADLVQSMMPIVEYVKNAMKPALEQIGKAFDAVMGVVKKLGEAFGALIDGMKPLLEPLMTIAGILIGAFFTAVSTVTQVLAKFIEIIANVITWVVDTVKNITHFTDIFKSMGDTIHRVVSDVSGFFKNLQKAAQDAVKGVMDWFGSLPDRIWGIFSGAGNWLYNAGQNIINGFWNGLVDTFAGVQDWVCGIGDWIAANKGPKEYDLGLLVKNGQWIMQGFEAGLRKQFPAIEGVMSDVSDLMGIDGGMGISSASSSLAGRVGGSNVLNVYVDKMQVRDDNDVYLISEQLNDIWRREMAGALV